MEKEIVFEGALNFKASSVKDGRLKPETARELFDSVLACVPEGSESTAWVEFVPSGVAIHWLEPKRDG